MEYITEICLKLDDNNNQTIVPFALSLASQLVHGTQQNLDLQLSHVPSSLWGHTGLGRLQKNCQLAPWTQGYCQTLAVRYHRGRTHCRLRCQLHLSYLHRLKTGPNTRYLLHLAVPGGTHREDHRYRSIEIFCKALEWSGRLDDRGECAFLLDKHWGQRGQLREDVPFLPIGRFHPHNPLDGLLQKPG